MQTLSLERVDLPSRHVEPGLRTVAIIGMGSRGLSLLEQFIGLSRQKQAGLLRIEVFDPGLPGSGLHHAQQADYLMLNTMAGQLSAFSAAFPVSATAGPTFLAWCQEQAIALDERGHVSTDGQGRPVGFGDFVPRSLLGRYLQDSYRFLLRQCPSNLEVIHHAERVTGCQPRPGHAGFRLQTATGGLNVDAAFLTCGHAQNRQALDDPGQSVLIEGLGLTAMDALASLTQGRGGRYVRAPGFAGWRYLPSGREPRVFLSSRSGLPFHARPQWHPSAHEALPRLFFTAQAVAEMRLRRASGRLDFEQDVLPLIRDEMRAVFYQASVRLKAPGQLQAVQQALREAVDQSARHTLFTHLAEQWGELDLDHWLTTEQWSGADETYTAWFVQWIKCDLALSRLGAAHSPTRQALEVWRDYRDLLRLVADRNGLTEPSTEAFYGVWAGLSNRLVGGPQKERYEDLLALIQAGVVTVLPPMDAATRSGRAFDTVIAARVPHSGLSGRREPLIAELLAQGLIRPAHGYPADGIETDPSGRVVASDGSVLERLWALGPAVEGCTFYNHYVPTPDPACHALIEARRAVQSCLDTLQPGRAAQPTLSINPFIQSF